MLTVYSFPCVADESFQDFDNIIAYVIMIVGLGCIAFSSDFQDAVPFNYIYGHSSVIALSYIGAKVVCGNDLILVRVFEICRNVEQSTMTLHVEIVSLAGQFIIVARVTCCINYFDWKNNRTDRCRRKMIIFSRIAGTGRPL